MAPGIAIAVSAQGYGSEGAFDHRAEMTGHTIIKPSTGQEFLEMLEQQSKSRGLILTVKIFSHSYPRGIIMSNWSGFYDDPGPDDTKRAAYIKDLSERVQKGNIRFAPDSQIILFGCDLAGEFAQRLSAASRGTVIASDGGTYPEIWGGQETGVFLTTSDWKVYKNGSYIYSAGTSYRAW